MCVCVWFAKQSQNRHPSFYSFFYPFLTLPWSNYVQKVCLQHPIVCMFVYFLFFIFLLSFYFIIFFFFTFVSVLVSTCVTWGNKNQENTKNITHVIVSSFIAKKKKNTNTQKNNITTMSLNFKKKFKKIQTKRKKWDKNKAKLGQWLMNQGWLKVDYFLQY